MKANYDLICMSFDGCFVTDSSHEDIESAGNESANMGSKWYFYPFHFIVKGKTVKETGAGLFPKNSDQSFMEIMFKNKRFNSVVKAFKKANDFCNTNDLVVDGYEFEEILINQNL